MPYKEVISTKRAKDKIRTNLVSYFNMCSHIKNIRGGHMFKKRGKGKVPLVFL